MKRVSVAAVAVAAALSVGAAHGASPVGADGVDPWAGTWSGAALRGASVLDVAIRVAADGEARLDVRNLRCTTRLSFARWGAPGRVYQIAGGDAEADCGLAASLRAVIGRDGVMRLRPAPGAGQNALYGALRRDSEAPARVSPGEDFTVAAPASPPQPIGTPSAPLGLIGAPLTGPAQPAAPETLTQVPPPETPDEPELLGGP